MDERRVSQSQHGIVETMAYKWLIEAQHRRLMNAREEVGIILCQFSGLPPELITALKSLIELLGGNR